MGTILFERFSKIFKKDVDRKIIENYKILGPIKGSDKSSLNYISPILISKYLNRLKFSYR